MYKEALSVEDFLSNCEQIRSCSHLLKESLTENFIFWAVFYGENSWQLFFFDLYQDALPKV